MVLTPTLESLSGGADGSTVTNAQKKTAYEKFEDSDTVDVGLIMAGPGDGTHVDNLITIVEKRKDISVMFSFGARRLQVRNIFLNQGLIIGFSSVLIGSFLGFSITWLQKTYGIIKIEMASSILSAYPVEFLIKDLFVVASMVMFVSFIASIFPGIIATSKNNFINIKKAFV